MSSSPSAAAGGAGTGGGRPSDERRRLLNEALSVPLVSNFFPIERYYDAADKVYDSFQQAFSDTSGTRLDDAYVYGKRYCTFCVEAIPTHNYFGAAKYKHVGTRHERRVDQVLTQLVAVCQAMDEQERERQRVAAERERQRRLYEAQQEAQKFEELQRRAQFVLSTPTASTATTSASSAATAAATTATTAASALEKLNLLRQQTERQQQNQQQQQQQQSTRRVRKPKQDPSGEEPASQPSSRYRLTLSSEDEGDDDTTQNENDEKKTNGWALLPPPMVPPPAIPPPSYPGANNTPEAPPSYETLTATQRSARYHRTLWAPQVPPSEPETISTAAQMKQQQQQQQRVSIRQLKREYETAYVQAQAKGRITVSGIDTYQGRNTASTNGCTVISALVAARHLNGTDGPREISDRGIVDVIDRHCGPVLRTIRSKLGLGSTSLIIPSDVHDHLVDEKILQQRYFEGAAGGSVCDPLHMAEFLKLMTITADNGNPRKAAATFFFHEHVISIVKIPRNNSNNNNGTNGLSQQQQQLSNGDVAAYYDLIDSLPRTLNGRPMATRTRCVDIQALQVLLQWYTSSKFSDANCQYIDQRPWNDAMADFDPRVFQGFVWTVK